MLNRCVLWRICPLIFILCFCAYYYFEFKRCDLKRRRIVTPKVMKQLQKDAKSDQISKVESVLCSSAVHRHKKWKIKLEPWANRNHSLENEALRFIEYITTPQVSCENAESSVLWKDRSWALCLDNRLNLSQRINAKQCRVYSLGLGAENKQLEKHLAKAGCEVHCFDPSIKEAHLQDSDMWFHRLSVDWRDPNPAITQGGSKKLAAILNHYGHRQVDVLKIDMESAEWKILENLIVDGVLYSVGILLLEVHLHWAGFEVSGDEPSVVRYWFSLLRELQNAKFNLYHSYSDPAKPMLFLQRSLHNASSEYILGWVNSCYSPH